jgi:hypothetical protein
MIVKELIRELQKVSQNSEIIITGRDVKATGPYKITVHDNHPHPFVDIQAGELVLGEE